MPLRRHYIGGLRWFRNFARPWEHSKIQWGDNAYTWQGIRQDSIPWDFQFFTYDEEDLTWDGVDVKNGDG